MVTGSFLMNSSNSLKTGYYKLKTGYWQQFLIIREIPYSKGFQGS